MAQEVQQVHSPESWYFNFTGEHSCLSVLGQNAEQEIVCEWLSIETFHSIFGSFASDEQVGTLHGSICPRCLNG